MSTKNKSPYLTEGRLSDIVSAIPVLGAYEQYASRGVKEWSEKLGAPTSSEGWQDVFEQHPEFFRTHVDGQKVWAGVRWRWALDRDYDPVTGKKIPRNEIQSNSDQLSRLTRAPLSSDQIEALISTAIEMHNAAIERARHSRSWIPVVIPAITTLVGVALGAWLKS